MKTFDVWWKEQPESKIGGIAILDSLRKQFLEVAMRAWNYNKTIDGLLIQGIGCFRQDEKGYSCHCIHYESGKGYGNPFCKKYKKVLYNVNCLCDDFRLTAERIKESETYERMEGDH